MSSCNLLFWKRKTLDTGVKDPERGLSDSRPAADADSPQSPRLGNVDLTSTVTAGKVPMVTVKMKHTDRAVTQIFSRNKRHLAIEGRHPPLLKDFGHRPPPEPMFGRN